MSSTNNLVKFKPTYLYIKQHSITGLLYFGKTEQVDPVKYRGSGKYWLNHIKKHGEKYVVTLWYCLFFDAHDIEQFALMCSTQWNIVDDTQWANLKEENGLDGGAAFTGMMHSDESKSKMREAKLGVVCSAEHRNNVSIALSGRSLKSETKRKIGDAKKIGLYHTPNGVFDTLISAAVANGCHDMTIYNRCHNSEKIIERGVNRGKTWRDVGFSFVAD